MDMSVPNPESEQFPMKELYNLILSEIKQMLKSEIKKNTLQLTLLYQMYKVDIVSYILKFKAGKVFF